MAQHYLTVRTQDRPDAIFSFASWPAVERAAKDTFELNSAAIIMGIRASGAVTDLSAGFRNAMYLKQQERERAHVESMSDDEVLREMARINNSVRNCGYPRYSHQYASAPLADRYETMMKQRKAEAEWASAMEHYCFGGDDDRPSSPPIVVRDDECVLGVSPYISSGVRDRRSADTFFLPFGMVMVLLGLLAAVAMSQ